MYEHSFELAASKKRGRPAGSDDRREDILEGALRCFVDRGFHGTAIPQIAQRAGVAAGTIYHYFPSKEALFAEILVQLWDSSAAQVDLTYQPDRPLRDQLLDIAATPE
mgnify:CR=1 FL=1